MTNLHAQLLDVHPVTHDMELPIIIACFTQVTTIHVVSYNGNYTCLLMKGINCKLSFSDILQLNEILIIFSKFCILLLAGMRNRKKTQNT